MAVTFDEHEIRYEHPDGVIEAVPWDEIEQIWIQTTDQGPWKMDVFWVIADSGGECFIPSETSGEAELLERLQQLPNFDNEQVIAAMGSTGNAKFICWTRD